MWSCLQLPLFLFLLFVFVSVSFLDLLWTAWQYPLILRRCCGAFRSLVLDPLFGVIGLSFDRGYAVTFVRSFFLLVFIKKAKGIVLRFYNAFASVLDLFLNDSLFSIVIISTLHGIQTRRPCYNAIFFFTFLSVEFVIA